MAEQVQFQCHLLLKISLSLSLCLSVSVSMSVSLCAHMHSLTCHSTCVVIGGIVQKLFLSFYHVDPGDPTQIISWQQGSRPAELSH